MKINDLIYGKFDVAFIGGMLISMVVIVALGISRNDAKLTYEPMILIGMTLVLPFLRMWLNSGEQQNPNEVKYE